ncbi:glucosamine-6-phosphate deaminase [Aestuariimicrobium sp. p3-SID1156]|uniref:glucosamine-6-phosphate deaminase n=1 Tax=Aestuariimicrobium sp. p3-SID1156 TaxID=2916038 RepID=UPI00223BA707|nr:glucosamine-6-phosphate deaminase [Aestuariimicrobium sp. p3-SID1156]MCT1458439.1 glucosamine-6-phosphate deaminase [Aestuariimicrobium sp. p3-SID1156]
MDVIICKDPAEVGRTAARRVMEILRRTSQPVLGVATGSSPLDLYHELARAVGAGEVDLSNLSCFALDEYIGLEPNDPNSYADTIRQTVTEPLHLDPARVHVPRGIGEDLDQGCRDYEEAIRVAGGVDVQILGIGANGHLGFNEPGSSFGGRTHLQRLTEQTREDNQRFFGDRDVPTHCVTQGLGTIMDARHLVLVAMGENKADAIAAACEGPVTAMCPASILQFHPDAWVVVDRAAASKLHHHWVEPVGVTQ